MKDYVLCDVPFVIWGTQNKRYECGKVMRLRENNYCNHYKECDIYKKYLFSIDRKIKPTPYTDFSSGLGLDIEVSP